MAKLGEVLAKQLKKIGIDITTDEVKSLTEIDTEISDEIAGKLEKGLMTIEAAKGHPEVNKLLRKNHFGAMDNKMNEIITEMNLTMDEEFAKEENTLVKLGMLSKVLHDTGKKTGGAGVKGDAAEFAKKEADYQKQLKELKDGFSAKETEFATTRENDLTMFELKTILSGKDYIFPKEMDNNLKLSTAEGAILNELKKKGLSLKRTESGLTLLNKDGNPAYSESNEALEPNTFIDGVLTQNKLLKVNDDQHQQQQQQHNGTIITNSTKGNSSVMAEIDADIKLHQ